MKVPDPYIAAALESIGAIDRYRPATEEAFQEDELVQDAVLMRLQDLGENLNRVRQQFPAFWDTHASADWKNAVGLRNIISHAYGSVRMGLIWTVIAEELGQLKESLKASLS